MPRLRARIAAWLVDAAQLGDDPAIGRSPRLIAWLGRISCATRITDSSPLPLPLRESPAGSAWPIGLRVRCDSIRRITSRMSVIRSRKSSCWICANCAA